jgi:hypothetical protein
MSQYLKVLYRCWTKLLINKKRYKFIFKIDFLKNSNVLANFAAPYVPRYGVLFNNKMQYFCLFICTRE